MVPTLLCCFVTLALALAVVLRLIAIGVFAPTTCCKGCGFTLLL